MLDRILASRVVHRYLRAKMAANIRLNSETVQGMGVLIPTLKVSSVVEPLITIPYLEKLVSISEWSAAEVLGKLIRYLKNEFSGVEPFPVSELWLYLEDRGVDAEEISRLQAVTSPRAKKLKALDLGDAYREFYQAIVKPVALINIDLEKDGHLTPEVVAWGRAILSLKGKAKALWERQIQKVYLRQGSRGTEDADYQVGGKITLVLHGRAKPPSIAILRSHVVHELGHALQDQLRLSLPIGGLYGSPPFVSAYADKNTDEDFAETFMFFVLEPQHLRRMAPEKYRDMASRV